MYRNIDFEDVCMQENDLLTAEKIKKKARNNSRSIVFKVILALVAILIILNILGIIPSGKQILCWYSIVTESDEVKESIIKSADNDTSKLLACKEDGVEWLISKDSFDCAYVIPENSVVCIFKTTYFEYEDTSNIAVVYDARCVSVSSRGGKYLSHNLNSTHIKHNNPTVFQGECKTKWDCYSDCVAQFGPLIKLPW